MAKKSVKTNSKTVKRKSGFNKREFSLFIVIFAVVGAFTLWVSLAAPRNGGGKPSSGSSTITGPVMVADLNSDGLPNYGDTVTFTVSTTATDQPFVNLKCSQNGSVVLNGTQGFFATALNSNYNFGLGSGAWQSGPADCTAYLQMANKHGGWTQLASLSFHVNP